MTDTVTDAAIQELLVAAWRARRAAYAPYSKFAVGSAVLTESGLVFTGANVENASYGLTICAERAAVFAAVTAGQRVIRAIAIVADTPIPCPPCGACRQVVHEFGEGAVVVAENARGVRRRWILGDLLPDAFRLNG